MNEELKNLIKTWVSAIISMSYCYYISSRIKTGVLRLLSILPICSLFLLLPLSLSTVHFSGSMAFFLSWLANFKLILFAFDQGPLYPLPPNLFRFICFACFPIKPQQNPNSHYIPKWVFAVKLVILCMLLYLYDYRDNLPRIALVALYSLHVYLELELLLALVKVFVNTFLGCEIEPQFDEPYLATSLQDFWSRRWNLMVPAILRPFVHHPVRRASERLVGPTWAPIPGILASFAVSGLVHELIFFYLTRLPPTWEVTSFFALHGVCTAVEVAAKRTMVVRRRWRLSTAEKRLLTVGFVVVSGGWLFFPQLMRSAMLEKLANEASLFIDFFKRKLLFSS